jgi:outer membrane beta-barrel protein
MKLWIRILPVLLVQHLVSPSSLCAQEKIEFPEEELATESVLPIFDNSRGVLNRNVVTEGRFEFGGGAGLALNEPFYNPLHFQLQGTYHFDELHAVNVIGMFLMSGPSSYGDQLKSAPTNFDPSLAPAPSSILMINYQLTAFYGKISLTKKSVMNLSLFGTAGAGVLGLDSGTQLPALNIGFGQKFYFNPNLALRLDFRFVGYQGPDATSQPLNPGTAKPAESAFDDELFFNTYISGGLVFLL